MITDKTHVQQLASLLLQKGITSVVVSPGSRNAPLINTFHGLSEFSCITIVDERSAAYLALGMSLAQRKPVVVVCTSGTAAVNYGPAVTEAFYQHIPLIVLTADRPRRWIDQADGQTVRQENLFVSHILKSVSLQEAEREDDFRLNNLLINETLNLALSAKSGPVHINIPLDEPLYGLTDCELPPFRNICCQESGRMITSTEIRKLADRWNESARKMVIAGQLAPDEKVNELVSQLAEDSGTIVMAEHLANLNNPGLLSLTDPAVAAVSEMHAPEYQPDILLTFGEQIVSKRLKQFVRAHRPKEHWHISSGANHTDTYNSLSNVIAADLRPFLEGFVPEVKKAEGTYRETWKTTEQRAFHIQDSYLTNAPFCDLTACQLIANYIPKHSVVHFGNSSSVRLMQMFPSTEGVSYFGNRGTSGIDGSLSTAVGFSCFSGTINAIILGELSFFYDSNSLMNKHFPKNLRIIVLNNGGGNIFRMIGGPRQSPALNEHFVAKHDYKAKGVAEAFGIPYLKAESRNELSETLKTIFDPGFSGPVIAEVLTDGELSAREFQACYALLKR